MTGNQLRDKRAAAGLSQVLAAQHAGVAWATWQRWEKRAELPPAIAEKASAAIQKALHIEDDDEQDSNVQKANGRRRRRKS